MKKLVSLITSGMLAAMPLMPLTIDTETAAFSENESKTADYVGEQIDLNNIIFNLDVIPKNIVAPFTTSAVDSGVIDSGTTDDGFEYEIYGTYEEKFNEKEEWVTDILTRDYVVITEYSGTKSDISVPASIKGVTVTHIGEWAFANSSLVSINIPDSVSAIGNCAFYGCSSLTKINIPDSVSTIEDSTFGYCTSLTKITIPDSVSTIEDSAFESCSSLASLTIPDSVISIGSSAFRDCSSLIKIKLSENMTFIEKGLFAGCSKLASIDIPDGVAYIGSGAFQNCTSLNKVKFPSELSVIKDSAFQNTGFTEITIPDGITVIDRNTFCECANLKNVTIPDSVEEIGKNAFSVCQSLKNITVPETVKILEDKFYGGYYSFSSDWILYDDATISGYEGTVAETYSNEKGITFISLGESTTGGGAEVTLLGDANEDGNVNMSDATLIIQYIGNHDVYGLSAQGLANADTTNDGMITGADAVAIQMLIADMIDKLPYIE